jgi:hypothetical protein
MDALKYSEYRGMNVFAALSIASVMPLSDFVELPLPRKVHLFGTLVGKARMVSKSQVIYESQVADVNSLGTFRPACQETILNQV